MKDSSKIHPIPLEDTCKTTMWHVKVFKFILGIIEVNFRLIMENICYQKECSQQEFRILIAEAPTNISCISKEGDSLFIIMSWYRFQKQNLQENKNSCFEKRTRYSLNVLVVLFDVLVHTSNAPH